MTDARPDAPVMPALPAPTGLRYWTFGNSPRWQYSAPGSRHAPPTAEPLFTAEQMRGFYAEGYAAGYAAGCATGEHAA